MRNIQLLWDGKEVLNEGHGHLTAITLENGTQNHLRIGQADTDESLMLKSQTKLAYVWRSPKARLMLRCSTESAIQTGVWRCSEPFSLREGVITVRVNHDGYVNTLVVSMSSLSATKYEKIIIMINT